MRYTWTTIAIFVMWLSSTILIVYGPLPSPEVYFMYLMGVTVVLSYIGFKSV